MGLETGVVRMRRGERERCLMGLEIEERSKVRVEHYYNVYFPLNLYIYIYIIYFNFVRLISLYFL